MSCRIGYLRPCFCGMLRKSVDLNFQGTSEPLNTSSVWSCDTDCSYVPFTNWARFLKFFRCRCILAYMKCSILAAAATSNASIAKFWNSSQKSIYFRFAALTSSRWSLGFTVAIGGRFTCFLRKTLKIWSQMRSGWDVDLLKYCNASRRMRDWKWFFLFSSVNWLWILRSVWKKFSNVSKFFNSSPEAGILVLRS